MENTERATQIQNTRKTDERYDPSLQGGVGTVSDGDYTRVEEAPADCLREQEPCQKRSQQLKSSILDQP